MSCFPLLNIQPAFDIDLAALEAEYFKAQRQYHPDRFVGKPAQEMTEALQKSMDINQAYEILKNPLKRAQYLLGLQGIKVGTEADSVKPANALLMEIMDLREQLAEAKDIKEINGLYEQIRNLHQNSLLSISNYYANGEWEKMAQETLRLGYLAKISDEQKSRKL